MSDVVVGDERSCLRAFCGAGKRIDDSAAPANVVALPPLNLLSYTGTWGADSTVIHAEALPRQLLKNHSSEK